MRHRESRILGAVCVSVPANDSIRGQVGFAPSSCPPPRPRILLQVARPVSWKSRWGCGAVATEGLGFGWGLIWRSGAQTLVSMAAGRVVGDDPGKMAWTMPTV